MSLEWGHCPPLDLSAFPQVGGQRVTLTPKAGAHCDKDKPVAFITKTPPKNLIIKTSNVPKAKKSQHTEKTIQRALLFHFDWTRNDSYLNVEFAGGIADVLLITKARLCVEIEVKISMSDWNADQHKSKWQHKDRKKISRMYYAVPEWMSTKVPSWVPDHVGIIAVGESGWCKVLKEAERVSKYRASIKDYAKLMRGLYFRFTSKLMKELPKCQ